MKDMVIRIISGSFKFAMNFLIWFVVPKFLAEILRLTWLDLSMVFYIALVISLLAGLSGFYRKRPIGIVFSMASDITILAYILYLSGGGVLSVDVMGFHAELEFGNLLLILLLPVAISLVGKVWKLATMEAERRVEMMEET